MANFCGRSDHDGGVLQLISIPYRLVTHTAALKTTVHRSAPVGCTIYLLGLALAPVVEVVLYLAVLRIQDPVPFLTPVSEFWNRFFSRSLIPDPKPIFFKSFMTIFWIKSSIILCKLAQSFFFACSKIK
jgi:hypothetical protein